MVARISGTGAPRRVVCRRIGRHSFSAGMVLLFEAALLVTSCTAHSQRSTDAAPVPAAAAATPPRLRASSTFTPRYPAALRAAFIEGRVVADLSVTASGRVDSSATTMPASTNVAFEIALRPFLTGLRFDPARTNGRTVPGRATVWFRYAINRDCTTPDSLTRVIWSSPPDAGEVTVTTCEEVIGAFDPKRARAAAQRRATQPPPLSFDSTATALGLTPLFSTILPKGTEEIRYWTGGGLAAQSYVVRMVRIGSHVEGGVAIYWRRVNPFTPSGERPQWQMVRDVEAGSCGAFVDFANTEACWALFTREPDWRSLWDSLATLGVSKLRDQLLVPHQYLIVDDGGGMSVEVRNGTSYRWYSYGNPRRYADHDDSIATRISNAFMAVTDLIRPRTP